MIGGSGNWNGKKRNHTGSSRSVAFHECTLSANDGAKIEEVSKWRSNSGSFSRRM